MKLIDVEGIDGVGKTTAFKYIINKLKEKGFKVLETREVGAPMIPVCIKLRELVLDPNSGLSGEAMELIFSTMRIENQKYYNSIKDQYDFIVSDRGWFSHLAYTDHNVTPDFTEMLYKGFLEKITDMPDSVVYLYANPETTLKRRVSRGLAFDVIESKGVEFQIKVKESFEKYLNEYSSNSTIDIFQVDANNDLNSVYKQLDSIIEELIKD